jgi:hypothetical protein
MTNSFLWAQALEISNESLSSWRKDVPSGTSLLFWALTNGKAPVGSYLHWAQGEYGLPVLTDNFMLAPTGLQTWEKFKGMNIWSEELIPVAEWDGVLFVATSEPNQNMTWSIPVKYVLADPNLMLKMWHQYTAHTNFQAPQPVTPRLDPNVVVTDEPTVFTQRVVNTESPTPQPAPSAASDTPPPLDAPEGFALANLPPPAAGFSADSLFDELAKYKGPTNTETSKATSGPEGFSDEAMNIPSVAEKEAELPKLEDLSLHTQVPENLTATVAIPSTPNTDPRFAKSQPQNETSAPTASVTSTDSHKPNASTGTYAHIGMQLPFLLSNYRDTFAGAFVFEVRGESLNCAAWTESFAPSNSDVAQKPISLTGPSAFRVAARTKNPYFGHVVETQINRQFFSAWGHQTLPPQIVVQPMLNSKNEMVLLLLLPNPLLTNGSLILDKAKSLSTAVVSEMEKTNQSKSAA